MKIQEIAFFGAKKREKVPVTVVRNNGARALLKVRGDYFTAIRKADMSGMINQRLGGEEWRIMDEKDRPVGGSFPSLQAAMDRISSIYESMNTI